jgi:tetracycline resistance efflux pump
MLETYPWLSILPPLLAIGIALLFRQVYVALVLGIWSGTTILADGNAIVALADVITACVDVFKDSGNTQVIMFSAFIGGLLAFIQRSGGVDGFIRYVSEKKYVADRRKAQLFTVGIGAVIPIESSISILITGTVARPIFDKIKISREKLAYLCDSTSAPICTLIPINAWGAYIAGLLTQQHIEQPFKYYLAAIPFNFYAFITLGLVLYLVGSGRDFFSMKRAEDRAQKTGKVLRDGASPLVSTEVLTMPVKEGVVPSASNMLIPIATMIVMMIVSLFITGNGDISNGSGPTSVLWAVSSALLVGALKYRFQGIMDGNEIINLFFKGVGGLIPIAILMMFAFAIGTLCRNLHTGEFVADVASRFISPKFLPIILFITTGFIAFSTGTSWGTWAIMFPIGMGIAQGFQIDIVPIIGSLVSGGVFGDHCSPISDSTLIASMASASDHIDHVNTQIPYALISGGIAAVLFLIAGIVVY